VVMTRDDDVFVRLRDRLQLARDARGDIFVSLHADSIGDRAFRGASVYTLSEEASDEEAAMLARKENRVDVLSGTDLTNHDDIVTSILIDLAQRDTNNKSIEFARLLATELAEVTRMVRATRRFAGFTVLRSPDVPSVLVELGYLSNPEDEANLTSDEHLRRLSGAFLRALDRHFAEHAS
jgi:N-acetylmuramoyl-L-alanine amidase